jgi:hypothetical protein
VVKIRGIQIVKKQAANSALLVAMLKVKVVIAPFFIARIHLFAEGLAQIASRAMPVNRILLKAVKGVRSNRRRTTTPALRRVFQQ